MATRDQLAAGIASVLDTYSHDRLELEFRLGHRAGGRFVPGVSEDGWARLKARLDASPAFEVRESDTRERIVGDGSGGKYVVGAGASYWIHKKRLHDYDLADVDAGPWTCRASLSLEVFDPPHAPRPPPATHRFERHKQRWSYVHRCWSIDLTRVASNLPHQLDNDGVAFEVEVELTDVTELFVRPVPNLVEWGLRICRDACAMMAGDGAREGGHRGTGAAPPVPATKG